MKQQIKEFVENAERVIDSYQKTLRKLASDNAELAAKSSVQFDEAGLLKVASDIHTLYGKPSNIRPEQLVAHWKASPNALVGTLQKLASAQLASVASGNHLGAPAKHEEVEDNQPAVVDADDMFRAKYSNR